MNLREEDYLSARARKIERALVRKNWTRVHLAEITGYDERTIRNVLHAKPVRDQTIIDICEALGIEPELEDESQYVEVADAEYGEYPRGPYRKYEGGYFAYRRSFSSPKRLMRTVVELEWCEDKGLIFREHSQFQAGRKQVDNSQSGHVYISQTTGLMHLVTTVEGSVRLITLTKMIGGDEVMRGAVLTQIDRDAHYLPSVSPIVLTKLRNYEPEKHRAMTGPINEVAEEYEFICAELDHTERRAIEIAVGKPEPAVA
jgi:DNA-binding Xre family transcriptional regulator